MFHQDKTFTGERVELTGSGFHGCTFKNCELVYRGESSPNFQDNNLIDTVFVFTDAAICTLYFLSNVYHAGRGGREVVEKTFEDIRQSAIHGRMARTVTPGTPDHSLR
jgi:hypothetical protein